ncbi:hypothetical protein [Calothrix sp. UHCC 0171]|nr:hypothetical protein [Calothrix sp. UHCC 0171]MEA5569627.1 hypothetical protein [Calothrix sp. UHCC 0171]
MSNTSLRFQAQRYRFQRVITGSTTKYHVYRHEQDDVIALCSVSLVSRDR